MALELEELRHEKEMQREEIQKLQGQVQTLRTEIQVRCCKCQEKKDVGPVWKLLGSDFTGVFLDICFCQLCSWCCCFSSTSKPCFYFFRIWRIKPWQRQRHGVSSRCIYRSNRLCRTELNKRWRLRLSATNRLNLKMATLENDNDTY